MIKATLLLLSLIATARGLVLKTTEQFNHSLVLDKDGNYQLYWNYNTSHVTFEVHVKTKGYVAFGLSPHGNMYPSDVVVGWIKNGKTYFKDYHTAGHFAPIEDSSQDWHLLHAAENDLGTVLKFVRKIDTCDKDDIVINDATMRLIYSYHPDDPTDETQLMYHGAERRGTKSISLLNQNQIPNIVSTGDTKIVDFRANNYVVPDKGTTYLCVGMQMPNLGGKHHMIEFEPVYTPGNEALLHHAVITRCPGNHPSLNGAHKECFLDWPKDWPKCIEVFIAWATGGGPYYFPSDAGYSVGAQDDMSFYVMQLHYDNPTHKSGVIDSSGMRMRLTSSLRQHEVGTLTVGHAVLPYHIIPPKQTSFVTKGYCDGDLLAQGFERKGVDEMKIISSLQHAHLLGYGITTKHIRNGTELKPIQDDPSYDFYFQEFRSSKKPVTVQKGDGFIVECNYNTEHRSEVAFGGLSTREEMCISFFYYYPKLPITGCESVPDMKNYYNTTLKPYSDEFRQMVKQSIDWSDKAARDGFIQDLANIPHTHYVSGVNQFANGTWHDIKTFEEHDHYQHYTPPPSACTKV